MSIATARPAPTPQEFAWKRWPATEAQVDAWLTVALAGNAFAGRLADRMRVETNTRFADWVDHLVVSNQPGLNRRLQELGYTAQAEHYSLGASVFGHSGGIFPRIVVCGPPRSEETPGVHEVAIKVESVSAFSRALDLGLEIVGPPLGPYRLGKVSGNLDNADRRRAAGLHRLRALSRQSRPPGADAA